MPLSRFFAATYDRGLRRAEDAGLRDRRARLLAGLEGDVLEVGAGTGLNLEHYPAGVRLVLAEPDPYMRRLLVDRLGESSREATVVEATAEALPFGDNSFDAVVSTLVLCSVTASRRHSPRSGACFVLRARCCSSNTFGARAAERSSRRLSRR